MSLVDAVYTDHAAPTVSKRYQFFPTSSVIDLMERNGYYPSRAMGLSKRARNPKYGKHLVTFRKESNAPITSDGIHEFIFVNSHDRTSSAQFFHGYFRWACSNGCIFGTFADKASVMHTSNNPFDDVMKLIQTGVDQIDNKLRTIVQMKETILSPDELEEFAIDACALRNVTDHRELLYANRVEDIGHSLWVAYQRAQEALIRGKFDRYDVTKDKFRKARPVTSINDTIRINTQLWSLANDYIEA